MILDPNCEIFDAAETICNKYKYKENGAVLRESDGFTGNIFGYDGSTAQKYANKYGYQFESIGAAPEYTSGAYEKLSYRKYKDHVEISVCDKSADGEVIIPADIM